MRLELSKRTAIALTVALIVVGCAWSWNSLTNLPWHLGLLDDEPSLSETRLLLTSDDLQQFQPDVVIANAYPPRVDPPVISVEEASRKIDDSELVLGVQINGEAIAIPVNMLTGPSRTIINLEVDGIPLAITWCELCHHGVVFRREVGERVLTFQVSGMLWHESLVMRDVETESLWAQSLGKSMAGTLKGTLLAIEPSQLLSWKNWKRAVPHTQAIVMERTRTDLTTDYYHRRGEELFVIGAEQNQQARHWPYQLLKASRGINDRLDGAPVWLTMESDGCGVNLFSRIAASRELTIVLRQDEWFDEETWSTWDPSSGKALSGPLAGTQLKRLPCQVSLETAWFAFHAESSSDFFAPENFVEASEVLGDWNDDGDDASNLFDQ